MEKVNLEFDLKNCASVKCTFISEGTVQIKHLEFDTIFRLLQNSSVKQFGYKYSLPENCVCIEGDDDSVKIAFVVEPKTVPALYSKYDVQDAYVVPYPRLLFVLGFSEKRRTLYDALCFAIKDTVITGDTDLYMFPYSNVSKSGSICMGGNKVEYTGDLKESSELMVEAFFSSPYNGDYYNMDRTTTLCKSLKDLFSKLNGEKIFPYDILLPCDEKKKLKEVIGGLS